jgi:hypothetical protein
MRASPASRRRSSTSAATRHCSTPAGAAMPRCSPTGPSATADQGLRSPEGGAVGGGADDGALRYRRRRGDVLHRHRDGLENVAVIDAAWGLGENVVQGAVDPDEYQVFKPLLDDPKLAPIIEKKLGGKARKMIYASDGDGPTRNVPTSKGRARPLRARRRRHPGARPLGGDHRGALRLPDGHRVGQGRRDGDLYIVQARPETVQSRKGGRIQSYRIKSKGRKLLSGLSIGDAVVTGRCA